MLMFCGVCYMCLSIWAILQMTIMGILYRVEALGLIEDTHAHDAETVQEFIDITKDNYAKVSTNCFIAAAVYVVILLSTFLCIKKARSNAKIAEEKLLSDEISCGTFDEVELTEKQKKKIV